MGKPSLVVRWGVQVLCWFGQVQIKQEAVENQDHMVFASSAGGFNQGCSSV